jgi:hypothetical protein
VSITDAIGVFDLCQAASADAIGVREQGPGLDSSIQTTSDRMTANQITDLRGDGALEDLGIGTDYGAIVRIRCTRGGRQNKHTRGDRRKRRTRNKAKECEQQQEIELGVI